MPNERESEAADERRKLDRQAILVNSGGMGFFKQTWVKILIIVILVLGVGVTVTFLLGARQNQSTAFSQPTPSSQALTSTRFSPTIVQPSPTPFPTSSDQAETSPATVQWKTYTDTKQKYSITYPPNWSVFPNVIGGIIPGYNGTIINSANKLEPHGEILAEDGQAGIAINVVGTDKSSNETLLAWQRSKLPAPDGNPNYFAQTTLNGMDALKHIRTAMEADAGQLIYLISNQNFVYWISISVHNNNYIKTVDEILSTFNSAN